MAVYVSLIARFVPLILLASLLLAGTRWLHDRFAARSSAVANTLAALWVVAMLAIIIPLALRDSLFAGTAWAVSRRDWNAAAQRIELYQRLGGRMNGAMHFSYGLVSMHLHQFDLAYRELREAATEPPNGVFGDVDVKFNLAYASFLLRKDGEAWPLLQSIPSQSREEPARQYLMARILERHGREDLAEAAYRRSLAADPSFHPALYRLLRSESLRHDSAAARQTIAAFVRENPTEANAPYLRQIQNVIDSGQVLVDYDPYTPTD